MGENFGKSWRPLLYKLKNKKNSKRLHRRSWNYFFLIFQNAKFWFFDFCQNIYLEVVLSAFKYKKCIFWIILSISYPGNFFHRTFSFLSKRAWKLLFLAYFSIFEKKIQKIVKIAKFQLNLDHPIFNIFLSACKKYFWK